MSFQILSVSGMWLPSIAKEGLPRKMYRSYQFFLCLIFLSIGIGEIVYCVLHFNSGGNLADLSEVLYAAPLAAICLLKLVYFSLNSKKLSHLIEKLTSGPCKSQLDSEIELEIKWENYIR